jgi:hypothetical protein
MLEDRDYMRQPAYHEPRVSFTVALLIVNAAVFWCNWRRQIIGRRRN